MKRITFILMLCLYTTICKAQIKFVPGYFIDEDDQKTECLIRDVDWKNNPEKFEYKTSLDAKSESRQISNTKEFGITDASKYIRQTVKIDRSSQLPSKYSDQKKPEWSEETIFLKVLVEGKANLYAYEESNLERYFFSVDEAPIEALVFKSYISNKIDYDGRKTESEAVFQNKYFQQQLNLYVNCASNKLVTQYFSNLKYDKTPLLKHFVKYNQCEGVEPSYFKKNTQKANVNLKVIAGVGLSDMSVEYADNFRNDIDFGTTVSIRAGFEFEYILPFNNNKWGLIVAPNYRSYSGEVSNTPVFVNTTNTSIFSVTSYKHNSIQLPIGVRYYFYLNDKSRIFLNLGYTLNLMLGESGVAFDRLIGFNEGSRLDFSFGDAAFFGLGYSFNNRFSLESRYQLPQDNLSEFTAISTRSSSIGLVLGYRIL